MAIGLGGGGYVGIAFETTMGTYVAPSVYIPILSESLAYTEDRYLSPAIRKATMVSDVRQGFYHVEGDMDWEVDPTYAPYFMHIARLSVAKTGTTPNFTYTYTPSSGASGAGVATTKTASITIVRNARVFKYVGCVVTSFNYRVEDGILKSNMTIMGMGETGANGDTPPTPTFTDPVLMGAASHTVFTGAVANSPTEPTWAQVNDFQGFTYNHNDNGSAQNRIRPDRQASYIAMGETEATITSTLDFQDRLEYENFVATTTKAIKLESLNTATRGVKISAFRTVYTAYPVNLPGMGDIVTADAEMRVLLQNTRSTRIEVLSPTDIT